jgi:hypothetical protein
MRRYSPKWAERQYLLHADHQIRGEYRQSRNEKESSAVEGLREFDDGLNQTKKGKLTTPWMFFRDESSIVNIEKRCYQLLLGVV